MQESHVYEVCQAPFRGGLQSCSSVVRCMKNESQSGRGREPPFSRRIQNKRQKDTEEKKERNKIYWNLCNLSLRLFEIPQESKAIKVSSLRKFHFCIGRPMLLHAHLVV